MDELLMVGATGMVGQAVMATAGPQQMTLLTRRAITNLPTRLRNIVAPVEEWPDLIAATAPTVVVNCLGTTIKQAGSRAAFRAVDHDLVRGVAQASKAAGARHFISVSSVGASPKAGNFYLRTKGEVEAVLCAMVFDRLDILRPGLLTGERGGPFRPGEALAMLIAPLTDALLHGSLRRYRSIPSSTVARAIVALAGARSSGVHVHEHDGITSMARDG